MMFSFAILASAQTVEEIKEELRDTIALYIIAVAEEKGVDSVLALDVATCESGLNFWKENHNSKEHSVGIFQINTKVHPVTVEQARNPIFNIKWAMTHLEQGRWSMWKTCYEKIIT